MTLSKKDLPSIVFAVLLIAGIWYIAANRNGQRTQVQGNNQASALQNANKKADDFFGDQGESLKLVNGSVTLSEFNDDIVHYYNAELSNGKIVYFFVVKDKKGTYRVAANACQVCFADRMGFRLQGDFMVCDACGNKYPLEKIATEKGGCNPGPINPNLKVKGGKITISEAELKEVADLF